MQVPNTELFFHPLTSMLLRVLEREASGCWLLKTSTMDWGWDAQYGGNLADIGIPDANSSLQTFNLERGELT
jgi:hypothetical protein